MHGSGDRHPQQGRDDEQAPPISSPGQFKRQYKVLRRRCKTSWRSTLLGDKHWKITQAVDLCLFRLMNSPLCIRYSSDNEERGDLP